MLTVSDVFKKLAVDAVMDYLVALSGFRGVAVLICGRSLTVLFIHFTSVVACHCPISAILTLINKWYFRYLRLVLSIRFRIKQDLFLLLLKFIRPCLLSSGLDVPIGKRWWILEVVVTI